MQDIFLKEIGEPYGGDQFTCSREILGTKLPLVFDGFYILWSGCIFTKFINI